MTAPARPLPVAATRAELLAELISALAVGPPGVAPLELHDRGLGDPTVALLDAWATAGDVIGFYLDRIADEGYLATAREPGSLLALAGMLGHQPHLGLAASVQVAYTLQPDPADNAVLLPAGLLSQSVAGPGEQPQTFETTAALVARPSWNTLPVKLTTPLTLPSTGAGGLSELVIAGTTDRLSANDVILLSGTAGGEPAVVRVKSAVADARTKLTTIALQTEAPQHSVSAPSAQPRNAIEAVDALAPGLSVRPDPPPASVNQLQRGPRLVFSPQSDAVPRLLTALRPELGSSLYGALASTPIGTPAMASAAVLRAKAAPFGVQSPPRRLLDEEGQAAGTEELPIEDVHALEFRAGIAGLVELADQGPIGEQPGLERVRADLHAIHDKLSARSARQAAIEVSCDSPLGSARRMVVPSHGQPWTADLGSLGTVELTLSREELKMAYTSSDRLRLPPLELTATLDSSGENVVLTLPEGNYSWDPSIRSPLRVSLGDRRVAISWPIEPGSTSPSALMIRIETPLPVAEPQRLALDKSYDTILPGSHVVIDRAPDASVKASIDYPVVAQVVSSSSVAVSRYDLTAKVTELELDKPWIGEETLLSAARMLSVRAQPDALALAPVSITDEIEGDQIQLEGLVAGMEPGHLIVVTGTRSDLPEGTTVSAGEAAMVANVSQGAVADGEEPHTTLVLAGNLTYRYVRSTVTIYGNVVEAHQGSTVTEVLGSGVPSQRRQSFTLSSAPLLADAGEGRAGGQSTLSVTVDGVPCDEVQRISDDTPPLSFVTGLDARGHTTITFAGPLPPGDGNVAAAYRAGDGSQGNLRPDQLTQLLSRPLGVTGITNPLAGAGGTAPDGPAQVRDALSAGLRSLGRIVSVSDYADFARSSAAVGKATARVVSDAGREAVLMTVAGDQPVTISESVCAAIADAATASADAQEPVVVAPADLLTIILVATVARDPRADWDMLVGGVRGALLAEFGYGNRAIGENLVLSEIIAAAHRTRGVRAFTVTALALVPATATASELVDKLPRLLSDQDPPPAVVDVGAARAAWGDQPPAGGTQADAIAYLDPTVSDTLMLTEVEA